MRVTRDEQSAVKHVHGILTPRDGGKYRPEKGDTIHMDCRCSDIEANRLQSGLVALPDGFIVLARIGDLEEVSHVDCR